MKIVHIVGTGTIGEPLIGLISDFKEKLGIDQVTFHKNTPLLSDRSKVQSLVKRGAILTTSKDKFDGFKNIGLDPLFSTEDAIERASVVIDCTPKGIGHKNKSEYYNKFADSTLGFIAQGSEFGFGKMYARGINDEALKVEKDKFIHVVSCNTHNISSIIKTIAFEDEENFLDFAKFNCIRRANDVSQSKGYIASPQVGTHEDNKFGTHHAKDASLLFNTINHDLDLFSSAIKINTQYMHILYFNLKLKKNISLEHVLEKFRKNDRIAITNKVDSCEVFSFGRDHGHFGRILNQAVISIPSLHIRNNNELSGYCFTPQDGNSLLSSVAATSWFLDPSNYEDKIQCLKPYLFSEV
ncbi:MAG: hypothetical protein CMG07_01980 [Candidatus Marinimicrobia bacterium]|nr:hypothetical protein [Candidatus Neomarinimicrobiota bacterium]